ncbi:MAG: hypothetical protein GOV00_03215, partial [Candidatus Altiarchaeota archaeon]|nr:hypothetical protein [Candidatus Altiarchaeota archaeon]
KPGGLVFITLAGRYAKGQLRYCLVKTAEEIAPHTFVPTKGKEVGLVHYIFNQQRIHEFFHNFKILEMWKDSKDYYCFLAERKSKG